MESINFLALSAEQQHAVLRAQKAAVPQGDVDAFWSAWQRAAKDYAPTWRVQALVVGLGVLVLRGEGRLERLLAGGALSRVASQRDRAEVDDAIRAGAVQLEVHRGAGLMGPTGPCMVLHQATGVFRLFDYRGYVHPRFGQTHQIYPYDAAQMGAAS